MFDHIHTYSTITSNSSKTEWAWECTIVNDDRPKPVHAGPAMGYPTKADAEKACEDWIASKISNG